MHIPGLNKGSLVYQGPDVVPSAVHTISNGSQDLQQWIAIIGDALASLNTDAAMQRQGGLLSEMQSSAAGHNTSWLTVFVLTSRVHQIHWVVMMTLCCNQDDASRLPQKQ